MAEGLYISYILRILIINQYPRKYEWLKDR